MNIQVVNAIFKRNIVSYLSNPNGYVFICVFVLLSAISAFWSDDFFQLNLATLDQLNIAIPGILLFFVPAITMSSWAEERKEGTDELLLSMPVTDLDVVMGKYLACVAIFTISLFFSLSNVIVLSILGDPDLGIITANYFGYWAIGLAMIAIGMIPSFLTSNLTVAFILGSLLNAPLVFAQFSDTLFSTYPDLSRFIKGLSIGEQFRPFARGIVTFSSVVYFASIIIVALYLCMVLIGKRHRSGKKGEFKTLHYAARTVCLIVVMIGVNIIVLKAPLRMDLSYGQINTISENSKKLLDEIKYDRPVRIRAYLSKDVPERYVQTRLNLVNALTEFKAYAGDRINLELIETSGLSKAAIEAGQEGISPDIVQSVASGTAQVQPVYLGVTFNCGTERVVVPLVHPGMPIEYEMVRSISTVTTQKRKVIGFIRTDAEYVGRIDIRRRRRVPEDPFVTELKKQFTVELVDPENKIDEDRYDALIAVQPSTLDPVGMNHFIAAVEHGIPTVIFEDPLPNPLRGRRFSPEVRGSSMPRIPPPSMFPQQQQQSPPKGDINRLWKRLGVSYVNDSVIWQNYNPFKDLGGLLSMNEMVVIGAGARPDGASFNVSEPITSGFQAMLVPFSGYFSRRVSNQDMEFTPLLRTSENSGEFKLQDLSPRRNYDPNNQAYVVAALVTEKKSANTKVEMNADGYLLAQAEPNTEENKEAAKEEKPSVQLPRRERDGIKVIIAADIDMLSSAFLGVRNSNDPSSRGMQLDNTTFVLNSLDYLAGEMRYLDIRKRRPEHRILERLKQETEEFKTNFTKEKKKLEDDMKKAEDEGNDKLIATVKKMEAEPSSRDEKEKKIEMYEANERRKLNVQKAALTRKTNETIMQLTVDLNDRIRSIQNEYKVQAVALPPILPLIMALCVFIYRRMKETEGVSSNRLR